MSVSSTQRARMLPFPARTRTATTPVPRDAGKHHAFDAVGRIYLHVLHLIGLSRPNFDASRRTRALACSIAR
eukprot:3694225-Pyramimonas_sp.AAC.1